MKEDEVGRKKSKVEGKRETAPLLTPTAACSAGSCSSGASDEEREQGGFGERGGELDSHGFEERRR